MFGYLKARAAEKRARRAYELAHLESLIAANNARLAELREPAECRFCKEIAAAEAVSA